MIKKGRGMARYQGRGSNPWVVDEIQVLSEKAAREFGAGRTDDAIMCMKKAYGITHTCGREDLDQVILPLLLEYLETKADACISDSKILEGVRLYKEEIELLFRSDYSYRKPEIEKLKEKALGSLLSNLEIADLRNQKDAVRDYVLEIVDISDATRRIYDTGSVQMHRHSKALSDILQKYMVTQQLLKEFARQRAEVDEPEQEVNGDVIFSETLRGARKRISDRYAKRYLNNVEGGFGDARSAEDSGNMAMAYNIYTALGKILERKEPARARQAYKMAAERAVFMMKMSELQDNLRGAVMWCRSAETAFICAGSINEAAKLLVRDNMFKQELEKKHGY